MDALPEAGGTVSVPAGTYRIASEIVIRRSGTKVRGEGPQSVLKLADGATTNLFVMPAPFLQVTPGAVVSDIEISRLALDGNRNGDPQPGKSKTFFGIQIVHAERVLLAELTMRDWAHDAVSVGVGQRPATDITIRNSSFSGIGRNAIHLGYGRNLTVREVHVVDTPSQQWGPAAGNAVDVEVEGAGSFVDGFLIENSVFERQGTRTAGYGIALQAAFGPIRNGLIRGNVIRNHQHAVYVGPAEGIVIEDNWILNDDNLATGAGVTVADSGATISGNVMNLLRWQSDFAFAGVLVTGKRSGIAIKDNRIWGGLCALRLGGDGGAITVTGNQWANDSGCALEPPVPTAGANVGGNERRPAGSLDRIPPTVDLALPGGTASATNTTVQATARDGGEGVARVVFLVDGVPARFVDGAGPYELPLGLANYGPGPHVVEALAVDKAANVARSASRTVTLQAKS